MPESLPGAVAHNDGLAIHLRNAVNVAVAPQKIFSRLVVDLAGVYCLTPRHDSHEVSLRKQQHSVNAGHGLKTRHRVAGLGLEYKLELAPRTVASDVGVPVSFVRASPQTPDNIIFAQQHFRFVEICDYCDSALGQRSDLKMQIRHFAKFVNELLHIGIGFWLGLNQTFHGHIVEDLFDDVRHVHRLLLVGYVDAFQQAIILALDISRRTARFVLVQVRSLLTRKSELPMGGPVYCALPQTEFSLKRGETRIATKQTRNTHERNQ